MGSFQPKFSETKGSRNLTYYIFTPVLHWHNSTEAKKVVINQASNLLGVVLSHKKKKKKSNEIFK